MNITEWQAGLTVAMTSVGVWLACRWWYMRRLKVLSRQLGKLDAAHQSAVRMGAQARKQVDELQRLTTEYRRRLTAAELARRPRHRAEPPAPGALPAVPAGPTVPRKAPPGGWADTQPM